MCQCFCVHCACWWGTQCRYHKLCTVGLEGAQWAIPGLWRLSNMCFLLLSSVLFSSCSLGFYSGLHDFFAFFFSESPAQFHTLWRPSHVVLPILHHQEMLPPPPPPLPQLHPPLTSSYNARISDARVPERERKLTFLSLTDTYVHAHIPGMYPSFRASH